MSFHWHGIVGSVGIIGAMAAPGVIGESWLSGESEPLTAATSAPRRVAVVDGLSAPEALSYDLTHDVAESWNDRTDAVRHRARIADDRLCRWRGRLRSLSA
jgi:hypothetical protein